MAHAGRLNPFDFAHLNDALSTIVAMLVLDEFSRSLGQRTFQFGPGLEEQMGDGIKRSRRSGRKSRRAAIHLDAQESLGTQQTAREIEVCAEVILPIEVWTGDVRVHDGELDHVISPPPSA